MQTKKLIARQWLDHFPGPYIWLVRLTRAGRKSVRAVPARGTDLILDAFPRSATSFVAMFMRQRALRPLRLATHLHVSSSLRWGVRRGIPSVVIVREPEGAICSFRALILESCERFGTPLRGQADVAALTRYYAEFHERLIAEGERLLWFRFETAVAFPERILEAVNARRPLFRPDAIASKERAELAEKANFHVLPSARREELKHAVLREYQDVPGALRERAESAYRSAPL